MESMVNWDRVLYLQGEITHDLVQQLTPKIFELRKSTEPITPAIDSTGGSIAAMNTLISLITGPDQNKKKRKLISVVTNKAYSAAAYLLVLSDYAIALLRQKQ